jgi:subtilisin family serine protease
MYKASHDIEAVEAWGITTDCSSMIVAVTDTGMDMHHPDLAQNVWLNPKPTMGDPHGWNFVDNNADATDQNFHGTHVSGTIGAVGNNISGISGICWKASLVPVKFLDENGAGTTSAAVDALNYAVDTLGAKIINASWGIPGDSTILSAAVQHASDSGALLVAAAGNGDSNGVGLDLDQAANFTAPASYNYAGVIAVGAVDNTDTLASFSNYGTSVVAITAPGVGVFSTLPSFQTTYAQQNNISLPLYGSLDGTSMATPHVTGAIALTWSFYPTWTAAQVKARLLGEADQAPGLQAKISNGARLNIFHMLVDP